MELLGPKNDHVLKRLFAAADSPDLLVWLISALWQGEPPLEVPEVLNSHILSGERFPHAPFWARGGHFQRYSRPS